MERRAERETDFPAGKHQIINMPPGLEKLVNIHTLGA